MKPSCLYSITQVLSVTGGHAQAIGTPVFHTCTLVLFIIQ